VLWWAPNLRHELPILAHRVRKASCAARTSASLIRAIRIPVSGGAVRVGTPATTSRIWPACCSQPSTVRSLRLSCGIASGVAVNDSHRAIAATLKSGERRRSGRRTAAREAATASCARSRVRWPRPAARVWRTGRGGNAQCLSGRRAATSQCRRRGAQDTRAQRAPDARAEPVRLPAAQYEPWADAASRTASTPCKALCVVAVTAFASEEMRRWRMCCCGRTFVETSAPT